MITPSRWMTKTAQGIPDMWIETALHSNQFKIIQILKMLLNVFLV